MKIGLIYRPPISPQHLLYLTLLIPICLIWSVRLHFASLPVQISKPDHDRIYEAAIPGHKEEWMKQAVEFEIDGPFSNRSIAELCSKKRWVPGLIINCNVTDQGLPNIRNVILNCLRYAIEVGATTFVIPDVPSQDNPTSRMVQLAQFFEVPFFISSLTTSCPHLTIHNLSTLPISPFPPIHLSPDSLSKKFRPDADSVLTDPQDWASSFFSHIASSSHLFNASSPIIVTLTNPRYQFPLLYDSPHFVSSFGRLLSFPYSIKKSAAAILYSMSTQESFLYDPAKSGIQQENFLAAQILPSPNDTPEKQQAKHYLSLAAELNISTLYLASPSPSALRDFPHHALSYPLSMGRRINIVDRFSLLSPPFFAAELEELLKLGEEQQECVEYEVVLRASMFSGVFESWESGSWAWGVAMRRHGTILRGWDGSGNGEVGVGGLVVHGNLGNHAFYDRYSVLFKGSGWKDETAGRDSRILGASMWP